MPNPNMMGVNNMQNGMFPMNSMNMNPMFYKYQYFQMMQNQGRLFAQNMQNKNAQFDTNSNSNMNMNINSNLDEKKSVKSFEKSRDPSVDKSISTIKSKKM